MNKLITKLTSLLEVKKIIALMLTIVFSILTLKGKVSATEFITIFSMILSFYFGQSTVKGVVSKE